MLTSTFYAHLCLLTRQSGGLQLAIGSGEASWDQQRPVLRRDTQQLRSELFRKPLDPGALHFIDDQGSVSAAPTPRLQLHARFLAGEGAGPVRECGLYAQLAGGAAPMLLSYHVHARVEKSIDGELERRLLIDLRPRPASLGDRATRYLGNSYSEELHDLERAAKACQLDEIRRDRRVYFAQIEPALGLGYDLCANCFGAERSRR